MRVVESLEFQKPQRSEDRFSYCTTDLRLAKYSEVIKCTDFIFGMQGSFIRVVEPLEFQKPQRSEDRFGFLPQIRGWPITQKL